MTINDGRAIQQKEIMAEFLEETIKTLFLLSVNYFNFFLIQKFVAWRTYDHVFKNRTGERTGKESGSRTSSPTGIGPGSNW